MKRSFTPLALLLSSVAIFALATAAHAGDWPKWRGPSGSGYIAADEQLPRKLPANLEATYRLRTGPGHSGPVVAGDKLVFLDEIDNQETLHVLTAKDGRELWRKPFAESYQDEFGAGPRCTPLVDGDLIFVQSCRGELRCVSLKDGKAIWGTSYQKDFGVPWIENKRAPVGAAARRGYSGTPLVDGNRLYAQVGSTNNAGVVCFNKKNGKIIWKSGAEFASYASPIIAELVGVKQMISATTVELIGLDAESGSLLWNIPLKTRALRNVLTPVTHGDTVIMASHSVGMIGTQLSKGATGVRQNRKWLNDKLKINLATPVVVGDHVYGFADKDRFVCVEAETGKISWTQSKFGEFYASTLTDGKTLLVVSQMGELVLIDASPASYKELGRAQVCGKTWSFPAYANGTLYVRDDKTLRAFKVGAKQP